MKLIYLNAICVSAFLAGCSISLPIDRDNSTTSPFGRYDSAIIPVGRYNLSGLVFEVYDKDTCSWEVRGEDEGGDCVLENASGGNIRAYILDVNGQRGEKHFFNLKYDSENKAVIFLMEGGQVELSYTGKISQ